MYLRFTTTQIDLDSHKPQGVFVASYALLDSALLNKEEWKRVREILDWFNLHLPHPPKKFTAGRAIFWFKTNAKESIDQIWELVAILREHGHFIEVHKCRHLRNICYSDDLQVAAYPHELDGKITIQ